MADDARRIILERRAAFLAASLAALGCGARPPPHGAHDERIDQPEPQPGIQEEGAQEGVVQEEAVQEEAVQEEAGARDESVPPAVAVPCLSLRIVPTVRFGEGSAEPPPEARTTLEEVAAILRERPDLRLAVEGHRRPSEREALSRARAARVERELAGAGIDPARLCLVDRGTAQPLVPNDAAGRERNSRVEFRVLADGERCPE